MAKIGGESQEEKRSRAVSKIWTASSNTRVPPLEPKGLDPHAGESRAGTVVDVAVGQRDLAGKQNVGDERADDIGVGARPRLCGWRPAVVKQGVQNVRHAKGATRCAISLLGHVEVLDGRVVAAKGYFEPVHKNINFSRTLQGSVPAERVANKQLFIRGQVHEEDEVARQCHRHPQRQLFVARH